MVINYFNEKARFLSMIGYLGYENVIDPEPLKTVFERPEDRLKKTT